MFIGYARVSTQDQNLSLQIEALTKAGCTKIVEDKLSGSRAERPGLDKIRELLREGDTLGAFKQTSPKFHRIFPKCATCKALSPILASQF